MKEKKSAILQSTFISHSHSLLKNARHTRARLLHYFYAPSYPKLFVVILYPLSDSTSQDSEQTVREFIPQQFPDPHDSNFSSAVSGTMVKDTNSAYYDIVFNVS